MTPDDRARLRQILSTFDEPGLVALANKGLVRRAMKDLEEGGSLSVEERDADLQVCGPGWTVFMPVAGPAKAKDDTKATGITRQILAATIYLRDNWLLAAVAPSAVPATPVDAAGGRGTCQAADREGVGSSTPAPPEDGPPESPRDARLPSITARQEPRPPAAASSHAPPSMTPEVENALRWLRDAALEDLAKWAGKSIVKEAQSAEQTGLQAEVVHGVQLTVRFVQHEIEARLLPPPSIRSLSKLLDEFLTTAPRAFHKRWVVLAVFAIWQQAGRTLEEPEAALPEEKGGALRSREQVLEATRDLAEGMISTGLAHPSDRMVQRLFTLSVSAIGANLPRLARLLRALAEEIDLILRRDAAGDVGRLLDQLATAYALTRALSAAGRPSLTLAGQHRSEYETIGEMNLVGVGCWPWVTASGFEGLSVLFWDVDRKRFWSWGESRPSANTAGWDVHTVYTTSSPWGAGAPERISRSAFKLQNVKANAQGRLSSSQQTTAMLAGPTVNVSGATQAEFGDRDFRSWTALAELAGKAVPLGLRAVEPLDQIVVVRPARWGERVFDELLQRLVWPLYDDQGDVLLLSLPWLTVNEPAISFFESVNPEVDRLEGIVGRVMLGAEGLTLEPLALLSAGTPRGDRVLNPAFDQDRIERRQAALLERLREKHRRNRIATTLTAHADVYGDDAPAQDASDRLPRGVKLQLLDVDQALRRLAESGVRGAGDESRQRLTELADKLDRGGLRELSTALQRAAQHCGPVILNDARHRDSPAPDVLWSFYLYRLHCQAAALI